MKISDIKKLFSGEITVASFKQIIEHEITNYEQLHLKTGSAIPINVVEDDTLLFGKSEFMFLGESYINGALNQGEIAYLTDVLTLSDNVEYANLWLADELEFFSDFSFNQPWTLADVNSILERIKAHPDTTFNL